jgi:hypothetical protein
MKKVPPHQWQERIRSGSAASPACSGPHVLPA